MAARRGFSERQMGAVVGFIFSASTPKIGFLSEKVEGERIGRGDLWAIGIAAARVASEGKGSPIRRPV